MANELVRNLISATDLPEEMIAKELTHLLSAHGLNPETVTLNELREIMVEYLQDVLLEMKAELMT